MSWLKTKVWSVYQGTPVKTFLGYVSANALDEALLKAYEAFGWGEYLLIDTGMYSQEQWQSQHGKEVS